MMERQQQQQQQQAAAWTPSSGSTIRLNCDFCASRKVKCSGNADGQGCERCRRKGLTCTFSPKKKPGPKAKKLDGKVGVPSAAATAATAAASASMVGVKSPEKPSKKAKASDASIGGPFLSLIESRRDCGSRSRGRDAVDELGSFVPCLKDELLDVAELFKGVDPSETFGEVDPADVAEVLAMGRGTASRKRKCESSESKLMDDETGSVCSFVKGWEGNAVNDVDLVLASFTRPQSGLGNGQFGLADWEVAFSPVSNDDGS